MERGPSGGADGGPRGGGDGPAGGADAGPSAGDRAQRATEGARERASEGRAERSERRQSKSNDDGPSERRASKRDDGPDKSDAKAERKASDEAKPDKRDRADKDNDEATDKAAQATDKATDKAADKADDTKNKADAAKPGGARDAKQAETDLREPGKAADDAKRAEGKPSGDKPAKHVELNDTKRDNIRGAFHKEKDLKPRAHVDIDIHVGRRLPRDWGYRPVPITVIEIVPEYRDYVYVYADDEYVICDPDTFEVVAVVPADGRSYAGGSSGSGASERCPARLTLSRDERELILDEVRMNDEVDVRDLEVGWSVPSNVELQRFPAEVLSKADGLDACRYFVARDQLAIVDPIDEKVVLVIDKG
jgi:hypothetical protein